MPTPVKTVSQSDRIAAAMPLLTIVAALAYAAAAYFLLFKPEIAALLPGGSLDTGTADAQLKDDQSYLARLQAAKSAFDRMNADRRGRVEAMVPVGPDIPDIMVQTDAVAQRGGFILTSIDAVPDDKAVSASGRKTVRVIANFNGGDYGQFKAMLADLENALRLSDVRTIVFGSGGGNFGVTFDVSYVDPAGKAAAVANAAKP